MLGEALLIVLSVLLALGVDEWRDSHDRSARAVVALTSIEAEVRDNLRSVEAARANHLLMRDSLERYAAARQPLPARIYLHGIFNPAAIQATSWESARETGATSEFPYELLVELSRTYDTQGRYRTLGDALVQDLMGDVRRFGMDEVLRDHPAGFIALEEDFSNREARLIEAYQDVLRSLGSAER